jgi:hypothetical protein
MRIPLRSLFIIHIGIIFCLLLSAGCITIIKKDGITEPAGTSKPVPEIIVITLERTACFGACPVYSLKISGEGEVVFEGQKFVKVPGVQKTTISAGAVSQLAKEFENAGYFAFNDSYTKYNITDMPSANTSITIGSRTKSVKHYLGDRSAPEQLTKLENRIDETTNSAQWIK